MLVCVCVHACGDDVFARARARVRGAAPLRRRSSARVRIVCL